MDVLRAPYGTVAQLAYLESNRNNYVHGIYTNAEVLMYRSVSRVITSINFEVRPRLRRDQRLDSNAGLTLVQLHPA